MKDFRKYKLGAIVSPADKRDYKLKDLISCAATLSETYINPLVKDIEILDQGTSNECVACSLAYLRWLTEYEQSNNRKKFSPSYIYGNREQGMYTGEGMIPREALSTLRKYGICHYEDFPDFYDDVADAMSDYSEMGSELDTMARPFRISSYYAVNGANEVKTAIMKLGGVSVMYPVYDCMYDVGTDGLVHYNADNNRCYGNHQLTIVGWTESCWIAVNSWGREYGREGVCYIPFEYPMFEAWAVVDGVREIYFAKTFDDVGGHWAQKDIQRAVDKGIMNGYDDSTFRPDKPVTRAELCAVLNRLGLV